METQLEIVCNQSSDPYTSNSVVGTQQNGCSDDTVNTNINNNNNKSSQSSQGIRATIQSIISKFLELTKPEKQSHMHKHVDDDWEIPFERIRIWHTDFENCGSQGDVYHGTWRNRSVAVKRVRDVSLTNIRHLKELNHKNIIKFHGISENSNFYYIIMEYCRYGNLHNFIHSGRQLSSTILGDFAQQIASGMKYLHSKNIIHRDLKPSNILLTHNDVLKITDFGTHKVFNDKQPCTSITYAGTHAYMAPEVTRSEPYSFPVDVWSYGVVLWEILTDNEPYKNLDSSAVVWAVGNNSFKLPIPSSFPKGFSRILDGCWKAKPCERLTFPQICMILKGAKNEVDKITNEIWLPLQAEWKREIRAELNKHLQFKNEPIEDHSCIQRERALEEARQVEKMRIKLNGLYLRTQECNMLLRKEKEEVAEQKDIVRRERDEIAEQKEKVRQAREELTKREQLITQRENEVNQLKEKLTYILDKLNQTGVQIDCSELRQSSHSDDSNISTQTSL